MICPILSCAIKGACDCQPDCAWRIDDPGKCSLRSIAEDLDIVSFEMNDGPLTAIFGELQTIAAVAAATNPDAAAAVNDPDGYFASAKPSTSRGGSRG